MFGRLFTKKRQFENSKKKNKIFKLQERSEFFKNIQF
jgi:hypothetical protein